MALPSEQTPDIAGFERVSVIGRGPRAEVWRARSTSGREVALKVFSPTLAQRANFVTLFEKETSALSSLLHPNIVRLLERGKAGGSFFVALELMSAGSLRAMLRAGSRLPPYDVARIGIGICEALDIAHGRGLPHRHLVPENVFLDSSGRAKVADFGMCLLDRPLSETALLDARGDLHTLGGLLYELVSGRSPGLSPSPTGSSPRLDEVLMRALSRAPAERFGRASEMALALALVTSNGATVPLTSPLTFSVKDNCITLTISELTTARDVEASLPELERLLSQGTGWKFAYDLGGLSIMDKTVQDALLALHTRHRRSLDRVAFCSPRALVRSGALVVGGSVKGLPWKVFATSDSMRQWLDGGVAT